MDVQSTRFEGLSVRQLASIPVLVTEPTLAAACRRLGLSQQAMNRWIKHPPYRQALQDYLERLGGGQEAQDKLRRLIPQALNRTAEILEQEPTSSPTLARTIEGVLDRGGLPRQRKKEREPSTQLSKDSIRLLLDVQQELDAADEPLEEYAYAYKRQRSKRR